MSLAQRWIPGGWTEREVVVGGVPFSMLLPAEPDTVLLHFEEHALEPQPLGADPYWAQLWPTSLLLAEKILATDWSGRRSAIELGCGVGLTGLAALHQGLDVTFSDYNPVAVQLALENAARCGYRQAQGLVLDWRSPPVVPFDVVLASDVIYDRQLHLPLIRTIEALAQPGSTIWIADGGRSATEDFVCIALERWQIDLFDRQDRPQSSIHVGEYRRMVCRPAAGSS